MPDKLILPKNHFLIESSAEISKVCKPLFDAYNITGFIYAKIYADGSALPLPSDRGYLNLHLSHEFPAIAPIPDELWQEQSFYFLPGISQDKQYQELLHLTRTVLNQDHPFYIIDKCSNYIELYAFVAAPDNCQIINTYLNNIPELKKFKFYFKSETMKLRQEGEKYKLQFPEHLIPNFSIEPQNISQSKKRRQFAQTLEVKNYLLDKFNISLTKREVDCLYYLGKGHSLKGIGNQLNLTSRTVETHLNKIKRKLGYHTKSGLIQFIAEIADDVWGY